MRVALISLLMIPLALGCNEEETDKPAADADIDADADADADADIHAETTADLIRIHEEVFDKLVLFTINERTDSGDCEYPSFDAFGPEDFVFTRDAYPYPDFYGTFTMTTDMVGTDEGDLWSMAVSYDELSADESLSDGPRPRFEGSGLWTVLVPGRYHTLDVSLSIDEQPHVPVSLAFEIRDYTDTGYRFGVTGRINDIDIDTTITVRNLCAENG